MSRILVETFYERIWHRGELGAVAEILAGDFTFRGSLGPEMQGHTAFAEYVSLVRGSLSDYHCEILECVSEKDRAFARMRFSGMHTGPFRGYEPSGKPLHWLGAALFRFERNLIADLWVLGDISGLEEQLRRNQM